MSKPSRILHVLEKRDTRCWRCGYTHRQADMDERMSMCRWCVVDIIGITCEKCGASNPPTNYYCSDCGAKL